MRRGGLAALAVGLATVCAPALAPAHPEPDDVDGDLVANVADNCPTVFNPDQAPAPGTAPGNRCNPAHDSDGDGVPDWTDRPPDYPPRDNCRSVPNPDQTPSPKPGANGVGAACDADSDGDGVFDEVPDNCVLVPNALQGNIDRDDLGDACDPDMDSDRIPNGADNCPTVYNPDQADLDSDGRGTMCDASESLRAGPPGAGRDHRAPVVSLALPRAQRFGEVRSGLIGRVRCDEACALTASLVARRRVLGRGSAQLQARGTTYVFVRFTKWGRRALFRRARVKTHLRVVARDRAGNRRSVTRALTLRR